MHLLEFVVILATTNATPVGCTSHIFVSEVDYKALSALDYIVRMALGADRDIAHRRIGADSANPSDSEHIVFLFGFATRDENGRQWVDERAGFPLLFVIVFFDIIFLDMIYSFRQKDKRTYSFLHNGLAFATQNLDFKDRHFFAFSSRPLVRYSYFLRRFLS